MAEIRAAEHVGGLPVRRPVQQTARVQRAPTRPLPSPVVQALHDLLLVARRQAGVGLAAAAALGRRREQEVVGPGAGRVGRDGRARRDDEHEHEKYGERDQRPRPAKWVEGGHQRCSIGREAVPSWAEHSRARLLASALNDRECPAPELTACELNSHTTIPSPAQWPPARPGRLSHTGARIRALTRLARQCLDAAGPRRQGGARRERGGLSAQGRRRPEGAMPSASVAPRARISGRRRCAAAGPSARRRPSSVLPRSCVAPVRAIAAASASAQPAAPKRNATRPTPAAVGASARIGVARRDDLRRPPPCRCLAPRADRAGRVIVGSRSLRAAAPRLRAACRRAGLNVPRRRPRDGADRSQRRSSAGCAEPSESEACASSGRAPARGLTSAARSAPPLNGRTTAARALSITLGSVATTPPAAPPTASAAATALVPACAPSAASSPPPPAAPPPPTTGGREGALLEAQRRDDGEGHGEHRPLTAHVLGELRAAGTALEMTSQRSPPQGAGARGRELLADLRARHLARFAARDQRRAGPEDQGLHLLRLTLEDLGDLRVF